MRLRDAVRAGDVTGRLGGDEFAILLESLESDHEAVMVAERILRALRAPFELDGSARHASVSIGVATSGGGATSAERLIREADTAMYRAKAAGGDRLAIFDEQLRAHVERRLRLERDLRNALRDEEFELYYQPIVALADGRVSGCEALLRWRHHTRGPLAPGEFVPLAEENGLIVPIGAWVLDRALGQLAQWRGEGHETGVSVNVSPCQLADDGFVTTVREAIARHRVPAAALCLEITETATSGDPLRTATRLEALRGLGVRIAFDDFGTGYSSLRHLIELPVDAIKLDRTFVCGLDGPNPRRSRAILLAVTAAAAELAGIGAIAEGVEHQAQLEQLRRAQAAWRRRDIFFAPPRSAIGQREPPSSPWRSASCAERQARARCSDVEDVDPKPREQRLRIGVEHAELVGPDQHAHRDQHRAAEEHHHAVVALDDREHARHAVEGDRGQQERDRQARGVEREQQRRRAPRSRPARRRQGLRPASARCTASRRSRRPCRRSPDRPLPARRSSASTCHWTPQSRHQRRRDEQHAERDDDRG